MVDADRTLGEALASAPRYLRAEVAYAVTHEGALHLEDILTHRIRLNIERPDRGTSSLEEIADIAAPLLNWDEGTTEHEKATYRARVDAEIAAQACLTDTAATTARATAADLIPLV